MRITNLLPLQRYPGLTQSRRYSLGACPCFRPYPLGPLRSLEPYNKPCYSRRHLEWVHLAYDQSSPDRSQCEGPQPGALGLPLGTAVGGAGGPGSPGLINHPPPSSSPWGPGY